MLSNRLIVFDALAAPNALKNSWLLIVAIRWNQKANRLTDRLFSRVPKEPLRAMVPAGNDSVEVFADDGVFRRFNNSGQLPAGLFRPS